MQLTWEHVTLGYPSRPAVLTAIDFEVGRGLWGLTGRGKTTFLRSAAALLRPLRGRVLYDSEDIWTHASAHRWLVGYAPQDAEELPALNASRYLAYLGALKGIRPEYQRRRAGEMLDAFHLPDRRLDTFSAGMKRRLTIAAALLNDPDVLLLDDPTTGLDPEEKVHVFATLAQLAGDRIILMATSLPEEADGVVRGWIAMQHKGAYLYADPYRSSFEELSRTRPSPG